MNLDIKAIGRRIRNQREFLGFTREQLAEMIDVTPKFCSDIELGVKGMSLNTLDMLSNMLKLSTDYILYGNLNKDEPYTERIIYKMLASCPSSKKNSPLKRLKI
jgi:transcriptional regulator with XRE-family HTH domain